MNKAAQKIRKTHRYLGVFLGIQFLFWTISGLYFSWTDIDNIHGDQFKNTSFIPQSFDSLISPTNLSIPNGVHSISINVINDRPYYWVNNAFLFDAVNGMIKDGITSLEAISISEQLVKPNMEVKRVNLLTTVGKQHEYRGRSLPVYEILYHGSENVKTYVSQLDGKFQTGRHRAWRWFDFLWMTHTMDYENRDSINTLTLRAFSLLGLITVSSGFLLFLVSSPTIRKLIKR